VKLVIQIPCYNEAETLPGTLAELPRRVEGFDAVELLVIDDGSSDGTADIARAQGADHVVRLNGHQGLARAFMAGLLAAVELGADVVVNTDADNQYRADDVPDLVRPVVLGQADVAIGCRPIATIRHFSAFKRLLQRAGSWFVRRLAGVNVRDVPSGFRAFSRDAARRLNVFGAFTYTVETVIQAGLSNLRVVSVPVRVNGPTRPSRLFRSNLGYIGRTALTILSAYVVYRPARLFGLLSTLCLGAGLALGLRYLDLMRRGEGTGHVQSVILCAVCTLSGLFLLSVGIIAHLLSINRRLLEELRYFALSSRDPGLADALTRSGLYAARPVARADVAEQADGRLAVGGRGAHGLPR
jgi:glycosyltransferase involved in cell wall biosynthesis